MFQILTKIGKRFAVFIPGLIIAYISFKYTLPFFDKRVPDVFAILFTYTLAAYVLIPAIIRFWRILVPPKHLPLYCVTPDGFASDPLNISIICTRRELIEKMEAAGWYIADRHSIKNFVRHIMCVIFGGEYLNAPVSSLYLFGRKQDLAFEIPIDGDSSCRHHVRFWATTFDNSKKLSPHSINWQHRKAHVFGDELLWVGAASLDIGIVPIKHNLQLTHMVHPDTNIERELIIKQFKDLKCLKKITDIKLDNPYRLVNRTWRGELHTDGIMKVLWVK